MIMHQSFPALRRAMEAPCMPTLHAKLEAWDTHLVQLCWGM